MATEDDGSSSEQAAPKAATPEPAEPKEPKEPKPKARPLKRPEPKPVPKGQGPGPPRKRVKQEVDSPSHDPPKVPVKARPMTPTLPPRSVSAKQEEKEDSAPKSPAKFPRKSPPTSPPSPPAEPASSSWRPDWKERDEDKWWETDWDRWGSWSSRHSANSGSSARWSSPGSVRPWVRPAEPSSPPKPKQAPRAGKGASPPKPRNVPPPRAGKGGNTKGGCKGGAMGFKAAVQDLSRRMRPRRASRTPPALHTTPPSHTPSASPAAGAAAVDRLSVCQVQAANLRQSAQHLLVLSSRTAKDVTQELTRISQDLLASAVALGKIQTRIIDGKAVSTQVRAEVKEMTEQLQQEHGVVPGIAMILVGERQDSKSYVANKTKAAREVGFHIVDVHLPDSVAQEELLLELQKVNEDPKVHGILVQLPLPEHINEGAILKQIRVDKDADCFAAENVGNLCLKGGDPPLAVPCTPAGCVELLQRSGVEVAGKSVVVLGRSNLVGMPMAQLLLSMDATVTVCHSKSQDVARHLSRADIVIVAIGQAQFVRGEWLKPGCVVIDVGINSVADETKKSGYRLVGDVNYAEVLGVASMVTPVPGGVGPMTIAMLLKNVLNLARQSAGLPRVPLRREVPAVEPQLA
ncbi:FOLD2 [Symbiodinium pilosum]|uniref:FOLD2 protein n=1 Tax=Symbiodinium pilosum TaxID=2952 RepID=A0A812XSQ9_SYMPI|nr:FOLD2 [Symbiodinium pilosum]